MKTLQISFIVTLVIVFLSSGIVVALNPEEASVTALISNIAPVQGERITVRIYFRSNSADELKLTNVGIHFDWMPTDGFYGYNLAQNPITVAAGGEYLFETPISVQVPTNTSVGTHSYYIGVDGLQGVSSTPFSWNAPESHIQVMSGGQTSQPTPTAKPNGQPGEQPDALLIVAIVAVVGVAVLVVIVLMLRRRKPRETKQATQPVEEKTEKPTQGQPPSSGQDFSI